MLSDRKLYMVKIKILFLMNFKEKMRNKPKLAMSSHIKLRIKTIFKTSLAKISRVVDNAKKFEVPGQL